MSKAKPKVTISIKCPKPVLTKAQESSLKKRMQSAVVLFFPDLVKKGDLEIRVDPKVTTGPAPR